MCRDILCLLSRPSVRRQRCRPTGPTTARDHHRRQRTMSVHPVVAEVTARIAARSAAGRSAYLERIAQAHHEGPARGDMACSNLAHGFAGITGGDKDLLRALRRPNVAIVSAYNDMLSAHQPMHEYPAWIKDAARAVGGVAQFAGGVPAMCDGITQG